MTPKKPKKARVKMWAVQWGHMAEEYHPMWFSFNKRVLAAKYRYQFGNSPYENGDRIIRVEVGEVKR